MTAREVYLPKEGITVKEPMNAKAENALLDFVAKKSIYCTWHAPVTVPDFPLHYLLPQRTPGSRVLSQAPFATGRG